MEYEDIYKAWMDERDAAELRPLKKDFYNELEEYMKSLVAETEVLDEKSVKRRLLSKEVENIRTLVNDMARLRNKKVLETALRGNLVLSDAFSEDEERIYTDLVSITEKSKKLLKDATEGYAFEPRKRKTEEERRRMLVRFLQAIPAIIGVDMKTYGPFKAEDVAMLPAENAEALMRKGVAVVVEAK